MKPASAKDNKTVPGSKAGEQLCKQGLTLQTLALQTAMGSANFRELCKQYQAPQTPRNFTSGSQLCGY